MNIDNLCMGCMREKNEGVAKCLKCGYVDGAPYLPSYLAPKTELAERYIVGKVLSYNGSGATYIGYDTIMNCKVRIREYMPENLASREKGNPEVKVNSGSEIQYKSLKMDFMDLARNLVKLNSLSEVEHVNDMFEANNTVYVVYEYIEGMTLTEFLKKNGGYLSWEDTKQLFMPLLSCLSAIHTSELIHRGISPDTILVDRSGNLKLTAFDIAPARTARSELVAQLFAGYAAPEQYTSSAWQGNYTDVYAVAATIYRTLTGTMPVEAISRVSNDNLVAASALNPNIPKNVSNALLKAMALSPEKRIETVGGLISELSEVMDFGEPEVDVSTAAPANDAEPKIKMKDSTRYTLIALAITVPILIVIFIILMGVLFPSEKEKGNNSSNDISSVFVSSEKNDNKESSQVEYLYSVPNFVNRNIDSVLNDEDYTEKYKFKVEYEYDEKYAKETIIAQSVEAGTPIEKNGTEIVFTVSRGSKYRDLPDLVGKNIDYAKDTLNEKRIYFAVETKVGTYGDPNVVCEMSEKAGTVIDISQEHTITLYVYEQMPEVSSVPEEDTDWVDDLRDSHIDY
ncbi:MAG: PASTA domain-containing protein [Oscillospiraceae bacterium]|nr:PASTA domain-containing protein [Oscillospiraceae bacterium]